MNKFGDQLVSPSPGRGNTGLRPEEGAQYAPPPNSDPHQIGERILDLVSQGYSILEAADRVAGSPYGSDRFGD